MAKARPVPKREDVTETTPLRLDAAVALAFPAGGMTVNGLRTEAARGRLSIGRVAGKDFTTLADIERMIERCRLDESLRASGSGRSVGGTGNSSPPRRGSSSTEGSTTPRDALKAKLTVLRNSLGSTSRSNTSRSANGGT